MSEYLFSYGTLRESRVQNELFGRRLAGNDDALVGYTLKNIDVSDAEFLARGEEVCQQTLVATDDATSTVEGTAFEVTYDELLLADEYEPAEFRRKELTLVSGKEAWVYLTA